MTPYVFEGMSPEEVVRDAAKFGRIYADYGGLAFPGLFKNDPYYLAYLRDLEELTGTLLSSLGHPAGKLDLADSITALAARNRPLVGKLFDLGTRPAKLLSAMQLKVHPVLLSLTAAAFGDKAMIASPSQSDTLHIFPPGEENWRFNAPLHQDYPYLLQSPTQVTFWVNFGRFIPNVGGVSFWPGSHKMGIRKQKKADRNNMIAQIDETELRGYQRYDFSADVGDLLVMNSLVLHESILNRSEHGSRVVQLFRYSDLRHPKAVAMNWASAEFRNGGAAFEAAHPDLVVA